MSLVKVAVRGDQILSLRAKHGAKAFDILKQKFGAKKAMNASLQHMSDQVKLQKKMWTTINDILK